MIIPFPCIIVLSQQKPHCSLGLVCMGLVMSRIALKQGYLHCLCHTTNAPYSHVRSSVTNKLTVSFDVPVPSHDNLNPNSLLIYQGAFSFFCAP